MTLHLTGDTWHCPELFLGVPAGGTLLASSAGRPEVLLTIPQCKAQPLPMGSSSPDARGAEAEKPKAERVQATHMQHAIDTGAVNLSPSIRPSVRPPSGLRRQPEGLSSLLKDPINIHCFESL